MCEKVSRDFRGDLCLHFRVEVDVALLCERFLARGSFLGVGARGRKPFESADPSGPASGGFKEKLAFKVAYGGRGAGGLRVDKSGSKKWFSLEEYPQSLAVGQTRLIAFQRMLRELIWELPEDHFGSL